MPNLPSMSDLPTTYDLDLMPAVFDMVHIGLAGFCVLLLLILLIVLFTRGSKKPASAEPLPKSKPIASLKVASPDAAMQLLGLFQSEARLVDFLNEELTGFSDADIGATARVVHEGGRRVLNEYFDLQAIRDEAEESQVIVDRGFNAAEVRLVGNVVGEAPFKGVLVHQGWKVTATRLPKLAPGHDARIVAPAEVEL